MSVENPNLIPQEEIIGPIVEEEKRDYKEIPLDKALENFANPTDVVRRVDDIGRIFQENKDRERICVYIPVIYTNENEKAALLNDIGRELNRSVNQYIGINRTTEGFALRGIIGEVITDITKHTNINSQLNQILVAVEKRGPKLSIHFMNPAKPSVDFSRVDLEDAVSYYSNKTRPDRNDTQADVYDKGHGNDKLIPGLEKVLEENNVDVEDEGLKYVVEDGESGVVKVAAKRDLVFDHITI